MGSFAGSSGRSPHLRERILDKAPRLSIRIVITETAMLSRGYVFRNQNKRSFSTWHLFSCGGFIFDPTGQLKSREKSSMLENGPCSWKTHVNEGLKQKVILGFLEAFLNAELVWAVDTSENAELQCLWSVLGAPNVCSRDL